MLKYSIKKVQSVHLCPTMPGAYSDKRGHMALKCQMEQKWSGIISHLLLLLLRGQPLRGWTYSFPGWHPARAPLQLLAWVTIALKPWSQDQYHHPGHTRRAGAVAWAAVGRSHRLLGRASPHTARKLFSQILSHRPCYLFFP